MAIKIDIVANVRDFLRGTKDVDGALNDNIDALDKFADSGRDAERALARNMDGIADDARDASKATEKTFREAFDGVKTESKRTGDKTRENLELTKDDVFKASLKAELVSNMAESGAEVARGFKDGFDQEDVETVIDGISDTIVSVGAMSGSVLGTAGGLAAATGLNLLAAPLIADAEAKAELYEAVYNDAFEAIKENGAALGAQVAVQTQIAEIAQNTDKMNDARRRANILGLDQSLVIGAMAGAQADMNDVTAAATAAIDDQNAKMRELAEQYQNGDITAAEWNERQKEADSTVRDLNSALGDIQSEFGTHKDAVDAAAAGVDALNRATERTNADLTEQAKALAASSGQAQDFAVNIDGATVKLRAMPDGKVVQVTDQGTAAMTQQQIDGIDGKTVTMPVRVDLTDADRQVRDWMAVPRRIGVSVAANVQQPV